MDDQLISIIIPIYNIEAYLERCFSSIQNQTYTNYEVLLIDDGSTDDSREICLDIARKDNRFFYYQVENRGPSFARNYGLEKSKGKYITFVDGDDWIHCYYLDVLYRSLIETQSEISMVNYVKTSGDLSESQEFKYECQLFSQQQIIDQFFRKYHPLLSTVWAKLYQRDLFNSIQFEVGRLHEDVFFLYKILSQAKSVVIVDQILYYYWKRPESITGSFYIERQLDHLDALIERAEYFKKNKYSYQFKQQSDSIFHQLIRTLRYIDLTSNKDKETKFICRNNRFCELIYRSDIHFNKFLVCHIIYRYPQALRFLNIVLFKTQYLFSKRSA